MPEDEDKYPTQSGRRRFVKGVVGSAALSSVAAGAAATVNSATNPTGAGGGATQFVGIKNTAGPAPRAMPLVPLEINDKGELKGVWPKVKEVQQAGRTVKIAEQKIGGLTYSANWFQYCGVQQYAGIQPGADANNYFLAGGGYDWMADVKDGSRLTVDMFENYEQWGNGIGRSGLGKPAMANWRKPDEGRPIPVQVLRSPKVSKIANGEGKYSQIPGEVRSFFKAATAKDFMAWMDKCTHFCCVPKFKGYPGSAKFGAANEVYCPCHQSIYDPFQPVKKQFIALPRPEE